VLALALVHHLAIANNIPLSYIAGLLRAVGTWLVIEFVPKEDSQVQHLLEYREDIFPEYTCEGFEAAFAPHFEVLAKEKLAGSCRTVYLMRKRKV